MWGTHHGLPLEVETRVERDQDVSEFAERFYQLPVERIACLTDSLQPARPIGMRYRWDHLTLLRLYRKTCSINGVGFVQRFRPTPRPHGFLGIVQKIR